jgi:hypothetical protein
LRFSGASESVPETAGGALTTSHGKDIGRERQGTCAFLSRSFYWVSKGSDMDMIRMREEARTRPKFPVFMDRAEKYPVGSPEWAGGMSARVYFEYDRADTCGFKPFVKQLREAVPGKPWQAWPPERPWGTPDRWARALVGLPWSKLMGIVRELDEQAARELEVIAAPEVVEQEIGKGKAGPGRGKKTADDVSRLSHGNSATYLAARLKRDHPEIAARVERGEFKSIRAAATEAGIVKKPDTLKQLLRLWDAASEEERAAFRQRIDG